MSAAPPQAHGSPPGPLAGIRVLELGGGQPGAYACWVLAELGARVVVLERRDPGDGAARAGSEDAGRVALHAGKRRLALDVSRAEARDIALRVASRSDALVSSLAPRRAREFGLDPSAAREANPAVVYAQATASGSLGGSAEEPMADIVAQAAGGLMWKTGRDGAAPTAAGAALGEHGAGAYLLAAVLGGLAQAALTGRGCAVEVSLAGSQVALQSWEIAAESVLGRDSGRAGLGHPEVSPGAIWGTFQARDGWLVLGSVDAARFQRLCALMDLTELAARYPDDRSRSAGIPDIDRVLRARFAAHDRSHWLRLFAANDIMGARVSDYDDVLTDEQAWANDYLRTLPGSGGVTVAGSPIQFDGSAAAPPGEGSSGDADDPASLLRELGYGPQQVALLEAAGVFGRGH